jgi:hypothetical protein
MMTVALLVLLALVIGCRAQFEFVQLFDAAALTGREGAVAINRNVMKAMPDFGAPKNGSLAISTESGTFVSSVYRISEAVLDRASALANGWRVSAVLTVQHSGASPDDSDAPGDGFSFAYGQIPVPSEYFALSDERANCGAAAPARACVAVCHMTYDMDIRPLGIHVLLNRSVDLIAPALGDVLPRLQRRTVALVVEQRPSTNTTSITSLGLARQIVGSFVAPPVPLTAWMFGSRTGTRTELVQLEHVVVSTVADSCSRVTSGCDANSIVLPLGDSGRLCATINTTLPLAADNLPVAIRYTGQAAWSPFGGMATIRYVAADRDGRIYAMSVANQLAVWTLERQALCLFTVRLFNVADNTTSTFRVSEGWIPSFVVDELTIMTNANVSATATTSMSTTTPPTSSATSTSSSTTDNNATSVVVTSEPLADSSLGAANLIGPIVGGVIGGIVLLAIIVGACVYVSKKRSAPAPAADASLSTVNPTPVIYTSFAATTQPQPPIIYDSLENTTAQIYESGQIEAFVD